MARQKKEEKGLLTEFELQLMQVLWSIGGSTASEVSENLDGKKYAYTTVSTMLRVLEKKSFVRIEKEGRSHRYFPLVARENYQSKTLDHVVKEVFSGSPTVLVRNLIDQKKLSRDQLDEIKALIDQNENSSEKGGKKDD